MSSSEAGRVDISQYDYDLPKDRIAQVPAEPRDSARLLVLDRRSGEIEHATFRDLGRFLDAGDLLVANDTRVFPARTLGTRFTGGKVEVFFLREAEPGKWEVMIRCNGRPASGERLRLEDGRLDARLLKKTPEGHWLVSVPRGVDLPALLEELGRVPLPPYIRREPEEQRSPFDKERYQTVYAERPGAVAAPTAGLHFTPELLKRLRDEGVGMETITLHVGPGTYRPIKTRDVTEHEMHAEWYRVPEPVAGCIRTTTNAGHRVVAVGTTTCRALESAADGPGEGWTRLFIHPPYEFRVVDAMITNFHLPRSSLLVMVCAFAGREQILNAYEEAKREGYRFYSYGDAMLIR